MIAVLGIAVLIVRFAGVGSIHGRTIRLYVVSDQASGVMHGTEVWLAGQKVGVVSDVRFLPPSADTGAHVVLVLAIRAADANSVRRDAQPELRAGMSLLGPTVVYLQPGTPGAPAARDGDTLRAEPQRDLQVAASKLNDVAADFGPLASDARAIIRDMQGTSGTAGALLHTGIPGRNLSAHLTRLASGGTAAQRNAVIAAARAALARADSLHTLVGGPSSLLGRFRRDSTLPREIAAVQRELAGAAAQLRDPEGTVNRVQADVALGDALARAQRALSALLADVRSHPARYINF